MSGPNAGRRGGRWRKLVANQRAKRLPCCLCGQPIDYSLVYPHPQSFTVQHLKDWKRHPELREDPANLDAAHKLCNELDANKGRAAERIARTNDELEIALGDTDGMW